MYITKNVFAKNSVKNKMMKDVSVQITINPKLIEMTDTHTLQAYSTPYKVYTVGNYKYECTLLHCFSCRHDIYNSMA